MLPVEVGVGVRVRLCPVWKKKENEIKYKPIMVTKRTEVSKQGNTKHNTLQQTQRLCE